MDAECDFDSAQNTLTHTISPYCDDTILSCLQNHRIGFATHNLYMASKELATHIYTDDAAATDSPAITLHWLNGSRSQRILWLLHELSLPYTLITHARLPTRFAPPSCTSIHPLGKFPILLLNSTILAESAHIVETLIFGYGPHLVLPPDHLEFLRHRFFMHYAEGSLMPPLLVGSVVNNIRNAPAPFFAKSMLGKVADKIEEAYVSVQYKAHFEYVEKELDGREYFAGGRLTMADIMMAYPLMEARKRVPEFEKNFPNIKKYLEGLERRKAWRDARDKTKGLDGESLQWT